MKDAGSKPEDLNSLLDGVVSVVIIDPQPLAQLGLKTLLDGAAHGQFKVESVFERCSEALEWLKNSKNDLIIFDPWPGEVEGLVAIQLLLASTEAKLLVFANADDSVSNDHAIIAGASGIIDKQASLDTLLSAVTRVAAGELWLSREATRRIISAMAKGAPAEATSPSPHRLDRLTRREHEILATCIEQAGATARYISRQLHISEHTLRNHLTSIYTKLGVSNRLELYAYAQQHGIGRTGKE